MSLNLRIVSDRTEIKSSARTTVAYHNYILVAQVDGVVPLSRVEDAAFERSEVRSRAQRLRHAQPSNSRHEYRALASKSAARVDIAQGHEPSVADRVPFCTVAASAKGRSGAQSVRVCYMRNVRQELLLRRVGCRAVKILSKRKGVQRDRNVTGTPCLSVSGLGDAVGRCTPGYVLAHQVPPNSFSSS